jgi:hypothetical protein
MSGYTWQIDDPTGIERAMVLAHQVMLKWPDKAMAALPGAVYLSDRVLAHQVEANDVVGAELYAPNDGTQTVGATA